MQGIALTCCVVPFGCQMNLYRDIEKPLNSGFSVQATNILTKGFDLREGAQGSSNCPFYTVVSS